jgi:hypothetical protein
MPQLRQLAIVAESPAGLGAFYQDVFELEKIGEEKGAVFVSDGGFNLALLPGRKDERIVPRFLFRMVILI